MSRVRPITVFDAATGEIFGTVFITPGGERSVLDPGQDWIAGDHDAASRYIDPRTRRPQRRRELSPRLRRGEQEVVLSGLPAGTVVRWTGGECTARDGTARLPLTAPSRGRIRVSCPGYRALEIDE